MVRIVNLKGYNKIMMGNLVLFFLGEYLILANDSVTNIIHPKILFNLLWDRQYERLQLVSMTMIQKKSW